MRLGRQTGARPEARQGSAVARVAEFSSPNTQGAILSLGGESSLWVEPVAVRERIGAWAFGQSRTTGQPSAADVRRALLVASALAEMAHSSARTADGTSIGDVELPADEGALSDRSGLSTREVRAGLALLTNAGVVVRSGSEIRAPTRIAREVLGDCPTLPRIRWDAVRGRLRAADVGIPAALAVLAEVARATGPVGEGGDAPFIRYSVRDLEGATRFSRSTVSTALTALERVGLITVDARRGQTLRCALCPSVFGHDSDDENAAVTPADVNHDESTDGDPVVPEPALRTQQSRRAAAVKPRQDIRTDWTSRSLSPATSARAPNLTSDAVDQAPAAIYVGEFAGTPIFAPYGTPLIVECDSNGRWTCRVGPLLRLGPADPLGE
jgi:DNA-binding transcriptional ArsR family regulator